MFKPICGFIYVWMLLLCLNTCGCHSDIGGWIISCVLHDWIWKKKERIVCFKMLSSGFLESNFCLLLSKYWRHLAIKFNWFYPLLSTWLLIGAKISICLMLLVSIQQWTKKKKHLENPISLAFDISSSYVLHIFMLLYYCICLCLIYSAYTWLVPILKLH